jgi:streptogramin lyase/two-component sensor histidine kinase
MIILMLIFHWDISAHQFIFNQITEDEGLPSNDIYDILVADDGRIWFASDNGVCRYDGNSFENFSVNDGLSESTIIKLYKDHSGRIWFLAYNGTLSYFEDCRITQYPFNDTIIKIFPDSYLNKIYVDPSGSISFSPRYGGKVIIDKFGFIQPGRLPNPGVSSDECYLFFEDRGEDYFLTLLESLPDGSVSDGLLFCQAGQYFLQVEYFSREFQRNYVKLAEDEYLLSHRNKVYYIRDHQIVLKKTFDDEVLVIFEDRSGNIWVSEKYDKGIYRYESADRINGESDHFLDGYTITDLIQDKEGGYWFSSEGNGVLYIPGFEFTKYDIPGGEHNPNITTLTVAGNRLWFSTRNKEVFSTNIREGTIGEIRRLPLEEPYDWIRNIIVDKNGYLWLSSTPNARYDPAGFPRPPDTIIHANYIGRARGDTILVGGQRPAYFYKDKFVGYIGSDYVNRIYASYHYRNLVYLGTLYGLYAYIDGELRDYGNQLGLEKKRINSLNKIKEFLIVGTSDHGLSFIRNDSIIFSIDSDQGLLSNNINTIFVENDTTLWVGSKAGLNRIYLSRDPNNWVIESFSVADGLPSNEINTIAIHDGFIWLATGDGISSANIQRLKPHTRPPIIQVEGVQINGKDTTIQDHYILNHDQNDIRISFAGISYRMAGRLKYRYQMTNVADQFTLTRNNWVDFPNLPPGEYTFFLNVGNIHNIWNEKPVIIRFSIKKPITQTLGFMLAMIMGTIILILGISSFLQRQRKIKQEARVELARMEQKIFRLQMNPHFVFNALLAIQGFMYQKNVRDAGRYLTSFAKLIRHTLYGSREEDVQLNNELEAMKYYLELQRLRFNENFDFIIKVDEHIFTESVRIPPLLIQPFLENAIEHGLQHKKDKGMLKLEIKQEGDMLTIEIEDNGIGREASMKLQKKKGKLHKSLGMEIVKSRLESMRKVVGKKIAFEVKDLLKEDGTAKGTLVRIKIQV